ncbi:hypothetical protein [Vibrio phage vB_pir03]|nr:hypothetical protein [Vibrio phage vB_pir03]
MTFLFIQNEANGEVSVNDETTARDPRRGLVATGDGFDPVFSRGRVEVESRNFAYASMKMTGASSDATVLWIHAMIYVQNGYSNGLINFGYDGVPNAEGFRIEGGSGEVRIKNLSGTEIGAKAVADGNHHVDVMLNTDTGAFAFYVNGVNEASGTSAIVSSFKPSLWDSVQIRKVSAGRSASEVIVTEGEITIGMRVISLVPEANGTHTDFTGDVSTVSELSLNPDGVTSTGAGKHTFAYTDPDAAIDFSTYDIKAVAVSSVASAEAGMEQNYMRNVLKTDADEHSPVVGRLLDTVSGRGSLNELYEVNPNTGAAWTEAEIKAAEFGVNLETPPLFVLRFDVRYDDTNIAGYYAYGVPTGDLVASITSTDRTGHDRPYFLYGDKSDGRVVAAFGTGGGNKVDGKDSITFRFVDEDGAETTKVFPYSGDYRVTDATLVNWFHARAGKAVSVYVE